MPCITVIVGEEESRVRNLGGDETVVFLEPKEREERRGRRIRGQRIGGDGGLERREVARG